MQDKEFLNLIALIYYKSISILTNIYLNLVIIVKIFRYNRRDFTHMI